MDRRLNTRMKFLRRLETIAPLSDDPTDSFPAIAS